MNDTIKRLEENINTRSAIINKYDQILTSSMTRASAALVFALIMLFCKKISPVFAYIGTVAFSAGISEYYFICKKCKNIIHFQKRHRNKEIIKLELIKSNPTKTTEQGGNT